MNTLQYPGDKALNVYMSSNEEIKKTEENTARIHIVNPDFYPREIFSNQITKFSETYAISKFGDTFPGTIIETIILDQYGNREFKRSFAFPNTFTVVGLADGGDTVYQLPSTWALKNIKDTWTKQALIFAVCDTPVLNMLGSTAVIGTVDVQGGYTDSNGHPVGPQIKFHITSTNSYVTATMVAEYPVIVYVPLPGVGQIEQFELIFTS